MREKRVTGGEVRVHGGGSHNPFSSGRDGFFSVREMGSCWRQRNGVIWIALKGSLWLLRRQGWKPNKEAPSIVREEMRTAWTWMEGMEEVRPPHVLETLKVALTWSLMKLDDKAWQKMLRFWDSEVTLIFLFWAARRVKFEFPVLGNHQEEQIMGRSRVQL